MNRAKRAQTESAKSGPDLSAIALDAAPRGQLANTLADQLRAAIGAGALGPGDTLPPSRILADQLGVSRGVVLEAFSRLQEEGLVEGRGRGGTLVRARAPRPQRLFPTDAQPVNSAPDTLDAATALRTPSGNAGFDRLRSAPARIDLTPGRPDLSAFPRAAWLRAERDVLSSASAVDLGYGDPQGALRLREQVSRWLHRTRGIEADSGQVVIVAGVAQALALLAQCLRTHGTDTVAIEDPGSLGVRHQLRAWGLRTPPVRVDEEGIDVAALEAVGAEVVVVTPAHQFPTGAPLSGARRRVLLDWAARRDGLIVEDDYDAEHRYDRRPVAALAASAPERVYYAASVSKLLAPAIRTGWVVPPAGLLAGVVEAKRETDLGNPTLPQLTLAALMATGALERHLRSTRRRHRARRDALIAGLGPAMRPRILGVAAGLHLTVQLADDADELAVATALLEGHGVKTQPLGWHRQETGFPGLVLGYASSSPGQLEEAGALIRSVLAEGGPEATAR